MKKFINICSYILNVIFIGAFVLALCSRRPEPAPEDVRSFIIERERAELPVLLQGMGRVYGITIDSLVFTSGIEKGYMVTTWDLDEKQNMTTNQWAANGYEYKYVRKEKKVLVPVTNIYRIGEEWRWYSDWMSSQHDALEEK